MLYVFSFPFLQAGFTFLESSHNNFDESAFANFLCVNFRGLNFLQKISGFIIIIFYAIQLNYIQKEAEQHKEQEQERKTLQFYCR